MSQVEGSTRCDGCGVEIPLSPVLVGHLHYCCIDCSSGLLCDCAKQVELDEFIPGKTVDYSNFDLFV